MAAAAAGLAGGPALRHIDLLGLAGGLHGDLVGSPFRLALLDGLGRRRSRGERETGERRGGERGNDSDPHFSISLFRRLFLPRRATSHAADEQTMNVNCDEWGPPTDQSSISRPRLRDARPSARARTAVPLHRLPDVFLELQNLGVGEAGEDIALIVGCDLLGRSELRIRRNEGRDLAVLGAADPDALLEARIGLLVGLRIRHVEHVVLVDEDRARPAELLPFGEQAAVQIENLDAAVDAVGDEQPVLRIDRHLVRRVELAGSAAVLAPGLDEFPLLVEFHDAVVGDLLVDLAVTVGHEDVAVGSDEHVGGRVELILGVAGHARLAERHQHLAVGRELDDVMALAVAGAAVGDPHGAGLVHGKSVRPIHLAAAEVHQQLAGRIEFHDRIEVGALAGVGAAALVHPDALAVRVDGDADRRAQFTARGQLRSPAVHVIGIGRRIGIGGLRIGAPSGGGDRRDGGQSQHGSKSRGIKSSRITHGLSSLAC